MPTDHPSLVNRARSAVDVLVREMLKFGIVGVLAFVIDLGGYNFLVYGPHITGMLGEGHTIGVLSDKPLTARIISASAATLVAWVGNRLWTFRHRRQLQVAHELGLFVLFNLVGMLIAIASLGASRYVLELHSQLADNIANIVGIGVASLFRFWAYRRFVFAGSVVEELADPANPTPARKR